MCGSICSVYECLSTYLHLCWDKSFIFLAVSQTPSAAGKSRKTFLRVSPEAHLPCLEANQVPGNRRSVSRACSGAAQLCRLGCHLDAHQIDASPETELFPQSFGPHLLTDFENFFVWQTPPQSIFPLWNKLTKSYWFFFRSHFKLQNDVVYTEKIHSWL